MHQLLTDTSIYVGAFDVCVKEKLKVVFKRRDKLNIHLNKI